MEDQKTAWIMTDEGTLNAIAHEINGLGDSNARNRQWKCESILRKMNILSPPVLQERTFKKMIAEGLLVLLPHLNDNMAPEIPRMIEIIRKCGWKRDEGLTEQLAAIISHLFRIQASSATSNADIQSTIQMLQSLPGVDREISIAPKEVEPALPAAGPKKSTADAGCAAILYTKQAYCGYHLPPAQVSAGDEKVLFDIEVKVKMRHASASRSLEALVDFPAAVLMNRGGLLYGLLDLIGAPYSQADVDADPRGLHAPAAIGILGQILLKASAEMRMQLDGELCATIPAHIEQSESKLEQTIDAAAQFRYPALTSDLTACSSYVSGPRPPCVSGLAFSTFAAALTLLKSRDLASLIATQELAKIALDLLLEPAKMGERSEASDLNKRKIDFILAKFNELLIILRPNLDACLWESGEGEDEADMARSAFDIGLSRLLVDVLLAIPMHMLKGGLAFGDALLEFLKSLLCKQRRLDLWIDARALCHLEAVLKVIDVDASQDIHQAKTIMLCVRALDATGIHLPDMWGSDLFEHLLRLLEDVLVLLVAGTAQPSVSRAVVDVTVVLFKFAVGTEQMPRVLHLMQNILCLAPIEVRCGFLLAVSDLVHDRSSRPSALLEKIAIQLDVQAAGVTEYWSVLCTADMVKLIVLTIFLWDKTRTDRDGLLDEMLLLLNSCCHHACSMQSYGDAWKDCLRWLRAIYWSYGTTFNIDAVNNLVMALSGSSAEDLDAQVLALTMGLFHCGPVVRAESALLLDKHFAQVHSTQSFDINTFSSSSKDPFSEDGMGLVALSSNYHLEENAAVHEASATMTAPSKSAGIFDHKKVERIAAMMFNTKLSINQRAAAADQVLNAMFLADRDLLMSCHPQFMKDLLRNAMHHLGTLLTSLGKVDLNRIKDLTMDGSKFIITLLQLTMLFFQHHFPVLQEHLSFHENPKQVDISLILHCALLGKQMIAAPVQSEMRALVKQIVDQCFLCLHIMTFHPVHWACNISSGVDSPALVQSRYDMPSLDELNALVMPDFLTMWFRYPRAQELIGNRLVDASKGIFVEAVIKFTSSFELNMPCADFMEVIQEDLQCADLISMQDALFQVLGNLVNNASSHAVLQVALRVCTVCIHRINIEGMNRDDAGLSLLIESLGHHLAEDPQPSNHPQQRSYSHCLAVLTAFMQLGPFVVKSAVMEVALHKITPAMCDVLQHCVAVRHEDAKPLLLDIQMQFVAFLRVAARSFRLEDMLKMDDIFQYWMCHVVQNEDADLRLRSKVLQLLEDLIKDKEYLLFLDGIAADCNQFRSNGTSFSMLMVYMRIAKHMGNPDSFVGHAAQVLSLRALCLLLRRSKDTMHDIWDGSAWNWVLRLLYDRRAEVKLLTLQILQLLPRNEDQEGTEPSQVALCLRNVALDHHEAPILRAMSVRLLLESPPSDLSSISVPKLLEVLGDILGSYQAFEQMSAEAGDHRPLSAEIMHIVAAVGIALERSNQCEPSERSDLLHTITAQKIFPKLIELTNPAHFARLVHDHFTCLTKGKRPNGPNLQTEVHLPRYLSSYHDQLQDAVKIYLYNIDRLLLQLFYDNHDIFKDGLLRSNKLSYVLQRIKQSFDLNDMYNSSLSQARVEVLHFITLMDMVFIAFQDQALQPAIGRARVDHGQIMRSICRGFLTISAHSIEIGIIKQFITASCRWVSFHVNSDGRHCEDADLQDVFHALLDCRVRWLASVLDGRFPEALLEGIAMQLDVCLSLCIGRVLACKELFCYAMGQEYAPLLQFYVGTVISCATLLEKTVVTSAVAAPTSMDKGLSKIKTIAKGRSTASDAGSVDSKTRTQRWPTNQPVRGSAVSSTSSIDATKTKELFPTSKARDRSRSYTVKGDASVTSNTTAATARPVVSLGKLGEKMRRRCYCALLVLQDSLPALLPSLKQAEVKSLFQSMHLLQRACNSWSLNVNINSATVEDGQAVSEGRLCAAVASFCSNLLAESHQARVFYLQHSPVSNVSVINAVGANGQAVHQLLTIGTLPGAIPSLRRLSLHVCSILLPYVFPNSASDKGLGGSSGMRSQVTQQLALHLQSLAASTDSNAQVDASYVLLPFMTALALPRAGPSCYDHSVHSSLKMASFSELVVDLTKMSAARSNLFRGLTQLVMVQVAGQHAVDDAENCLPNGASGGAGLQKLYSDERLLSSVLAVCGEGACSDLAAICIKAMAQSSDKLKNQIKHVSAKIGQTEGLEGLVW